MVTFFIALVLLFAGYHTYGGLVERVFGPVVFLTRVSGFLDRLLIRWGLDLRRCASRFSLCGFIKRMIIGLCSINENNSEQVLSVDDCIRSEKQHW